MMTTPLNSDLTSLSHMLQSISQSWDSQDTNSQPTDIKEPIDRRTQMTNLLSHPLTLHQQALIQLQTRMDSSTMDPSTISYVATTRMWSIDQVAFKAWSFLPVATVCTYACVSRQWNRSINPFRKEEQSTTETSTFTKPSTVVASKSPRAPFLHYLHDVILSCNMPPSRAASYQLLSCFHAARSISIILPDILSPSSVLSSMSHALITSFQFDNSHIELLSGCTQLRMFTISNAPHVHDMGIACIINSFPLLTKLVINGCRALLGHGLSDLYKLEHLTHLEITACHGLDREALFHISKCQHLSYLSLENCRLNQVDLNTFQENPIIERIAIVQLNQHAKGTKS